MTTTTAPERVSPSAASRTRARVLGTAGAVLTALAVWTIAVPLLDVDLLVRGGGDTTQPVGVGAVIVASLVASLLGWALLALLEHRTPRGRAIWTGVAIVVVLLSLGGPLTGATTAAAKVTLALMHLAVAAVLIPVLRRSSPTR